MRRAIGVDLGGSHVTASVIDESGGLGKLFEKDHADLESDTILANVEDVVHKAIDEAKSEFVVGIGIGSPGNIDARTGEVRWSPNLGWTNFPLGEKLRSRLNYPIFVGNDARCATLGEYTYGIGKGTKNFALLTLGTGIGGGIVAGGQLVLGQTMGAGEFGHHQIRPTDGFICACGKIGCFEAQASGTGLLRHAIALEPSFPRSTLLDGAREKWGSKAIRKAAQAGQQHALAAWKNYIADLALGISNIIAFVNPEVIALGGGVSSAGAFMTDALKPLVDAKTVTVPLGTKIVPATLGNNAGMVGAATMAFRGGLVTA